MGNLGDNHFFVFGTGEPGALEAHIRQLDKALDTSRFQIQQTENIIRSKTPTGPELDSSYKGYVRVYWRTSQKSAPSLDLLLKDIQLFQQSN